MSYPLVVYTKEGAWKTVKSEAEEQDLRPEYKQWQEWKCPETVNENVKQQVDVVVPDVIIPSTQQINTEIRKPGRPPKRY